VKIFANVLFNLKKILTAVETIRPHIIEAIKTSYQSLPNDPPIVITLKLAMFLADSIKFSFSLVNKPNSKAVQYIVNKLTTSIINKSIANLPFSLVSNMPTNLQLNIFKPKNRIVNNPSPCTKLPR